MGPSRGCRREGCIQQVKGEGRAHTRTLGTGGEGSPLSTESSTVTTSFSVTKWGGVTTEVGAPDAA